MSSDGHGIPDSAVKGAHDLMHHAEQEQHEHDAVTKRGLSDETVEKEHEFLEGLERRASGEREGVGTTIKKKLQNLLPEKR